MAIPLKKCVTEIRILGIEPFSIFSFDKITVIANYEKFWDKKFLKIKLNFKKNFNFKKIQYLFFTTLQKSHFIDIFLLNRYLIFFKDSPLTILLFPMG